MAYDAKTIANFILELANTEGVPITPMKLQKLVYLAHGWTLAFYNKPLINQSIEAWKYGPVVPTLYYEFKDYGDQPITRMAVKMEWAVDENEDFQYRVNVPILPVGNEHDDARIMLSAVWTVYKSKSAIDLSKDTHAPDTPWTHVVKANGGEISSHIKIPDMQIRTYFESLKNG